MPGFLGSYSISIDDKGRITIPSKFRAVLEKKYGLDLVVSLKGDYLLIFPEKEWEVNEENQRNINAFDEENRKSMRRYYEMSSDCEVKSGKILIPANHREAAGLKKDVVLIGMSRTFEIWDKDRRANTQ